MQKKEELEQLTKAELIQRVMALNKTIEQLNGIISILAKSNVMYESRLNKNAKRINYKEYQPEWTWVTKVVFVLSKFKKPMLAKEIMDVLEKVDTTASEWRDKLKSLSVHLNSAIKQERIVTKKVKGVRGYYFLLPEWLDKNGEIREKYKIKSKYV